jgi:hypothetical protein
VLSSMPDSLPQLGLRADTAHSGITRLVDIPRT